MGYGPLVRATTGVTRLWTSDEAAPDGARHAFYDATTIFPDHVVGRVTAVAALAALIRRDRTAGDLGEPTCTSPRPRSSSTNSTPCSCGPRCSPAVPEIRDDTSVHAVYPCAGDDEWCVISVGSDDEWRWLTTVMDRPELSDDARFATGRVAGGQPPGLVERVSAWTRARTPLQAAEALQSAGVAAGPMNRPPDILEDPQLVERKLLRDMAHPLIDQPMPAETGPAPFRHIPTAPLRPAPLPGQDTRDICRRLLGMSSADTERLMTDRVLFEPAGRA